MNTAKNRCRTLPSTIVVFSSSHTCTCPGQSDKKSTDNVFFSPQLILQKSNGQFQRNRSFFKVPEGVQHFQGGSNFVQGGGGSNCLFPIETHITCDFPGGSGPPAPPPPGSALARTHLHAMLGKAIIRFR